MPTGTPIEPSEPHSTVGPFFEDMILGGQDGLVNVLGIVLGVAVATNDPKLVLLAGLAATFAESIAMAAVAFTSTKARNEFYESEKKRELWEIENWPERETQEVRDIYYSYGLRGEDLDKIVEIVTSHKDVWLELMMHEELGFSHMDDSKPLKRSFVVGVSALIGSIIPLAPFFLFEVSTGIIFSLAFSGIALFITGAVKAKLTGRFWAKSGMEMLVIGMLAAIAGYAVGLMFGAI